MNKDNPKFIDASFLIALFLAKDDFHERAKKLWYELKENYITIYKSTVRVHKNIKKKRIAFK